MSSIIGQPKGHSLLESIINVVIGFGIATVANIIALPWFGYDVSPADAAGIGGVLTIVSIIRSYALRRLFNWFHVRSII